MVFIPVSNYKTMTPQDETVTLVAALQFSHKIPKKLRNSQRINIK